MATIATFLAGVTATALQYTTIPAGHLGEAVNALWCSSLVLGVGSAFGNLISAMYTLYPRYRYAFADSPFLTSQIL